ncbi:hypothetical protein MKQ70_16690 [Chitinophaga sedimenti]|uniref:hypothetical protein n=1 Tax=Chitinophaga sedimenti TaxID=2033606 RepID=UPI00200545C0|nr:hypothetical protein [Chitinophaga sedimenti]MCK7556566.1 hypothetical protein [Chitinophaga sedimenti]
MKRSKTRAHPRPTTKNTLQAVHFEMAELGLDFRDKVISALGWSQATYYRKRRAKVQVAPSEREKIQAAAMESISELKRQVRKLFM